MPEARHFWLEFCTRHGIQGSVPLFQTTDGLQVQTAPRGPGSRLVLLRSAAMEALVLHEAGKVLSDYREGTHLYEGLLYVMYWMDGAIPTPLYIGKAEKIGRGEGNLSANLKGINAQTQHPFARWGYNYAYHLGDLSAVVLQHADERQTPKYKKWAKTLFETPEAPRLRQPVFFWTLAWRTGDIGPWKEVESTTLTFLEYLLIGIASAAFPELLNREGVNRRS